MPNELGRVLKGHFAQFGYNPVQNAVIQQQQDQLYQQQIALLQQEQARLDREALERARRDWERLYRQAVEMSESDLRAKLKSRLEVERFVAAYVVGERRLQWQDDLIPLLNDAKDSVRQATRRSLIILSFLKLNPAVESELIAIRRNAPIVPATQLTPAKDFGPKPHASPDQRKKAMVAWESWWKDQGKRVMTAVAAVAREDLQVERLASDLVNADQKKQMELIAAFRDTKGSDYTWAIAYALPRLGGSSRQEARDALATRFTRMTSGTLESYIDDDNSEIRRAAVLAVAMKGETPLGLVSLIIDRLLDPDPTVSRAAYAAVRELAGKEGPDFGPKLGASDEEKKDAVAQWKNWWEKKGRK